MHTKFLWSSSVKQFIYLPVSVTYRFLYIAVDNWSLGASMINLLWCTVSDFLRLRHTEDELLSGPSIIKCASAHVVLIWRGMDWVSLLLFMLFLFQCQLLYIWLVILSPMAVVRSASLPLMLLCGTACCQKSLSVFSCWLKTMLFKCLNNIVKYYFFRCILISRFLLYRKFAAFNLRIIIIEIPVVLFFTYYKQYRISHHRSGDILCRWIYTDGQFQQFACISISQFLLKSGKFDTH